MHINLYIYSIHAYVTIDYIRRYVCMDACINIRRYVCMDARINTHPNMIGFDSALSLLQAIY